MVRTARFAWNADDEPDLSDLSELGDGRHDLDVLDDPLFDDPLHSGKPHGRPPRHLAAADWLAPQAAKTPRR